MRRRQPSAASCRVKNAMLNCCMGGKAVRHIKSETRWPIACAVKQSKGAVENGATVADLRSQVRIDSLDVWSTSNGRATCHSESFEEDHAWREMDRVAPLDITFAA